jgi:transposase
MPKDQAISTLVVSLDTSDAHSRRRLETLYFTVHNLRRALQRDAQRLCRDYWARKDDRDALGWKAVADDLGLNRKGFERLARDHAANSGWATSHVPMQLVYAMADGVFENAARHLWSDASGHRAGALHVTPLHEFATIVGRGRSHTTQNKWETFRLCGTLEGHLDAYGHGAHGEHPTRGDVAKLHAGTPILRQKKRMKTPGTAKWSSYTGPLMMVFAGGPQSKEPELQLPLRLPQGRGSWDRIVHFLGRPDLWHKIDLVRRADSSAPCGWRYEMHLLVLNESYTSPRNRVLLDTVPTNRTACVDVNVSNLAVVSVDATHGDPRSTMVARDASERDRLARAEAKKRRGQRRADRSRRAGNATQYAKSQAQVKRDERRAERGLRPVVDATPRGGRLSNAAGVPHQAYCRDHLSVTYRNLRRRQGERDRAQSLTKKARAHDVAVQLVAIHGTNWTCEDCNLTAWAKLWGKSLHAFAPGMVTAELVARLGGSYVRVATGPTALSSHCLCGRRAKKDLGERYHVCGACGFTGHRDLVSAALGTCVVCADVSDPRSARVNFVKAGVLQAELSATSIHPTSTNQVSTNHGYQDALTSQTHPLVPPRRSDVVGQGARSVGTSHRTARLNARSTAQSTNGPGLPGPAKVAHGSALGRSSPPGDLRLSS